MDLGPISAERAAGHADFPRSRSERTPVVDLEAVGPGELVGARPRERIASERWTVREPEAPATWPLYYKLEGGMADRATRCWDSHARAG